MSNRIDQYLFGAADAAVRKSAIVTAGLKYRFGRCFHTGEVVVEGLPRELFLGRDPDAAVREALCSYISGAGIESGFPAAEVEAALRGVRTTTVVDADIDARVVVLKCARRPRVMQIPPMDEAEAAAALDAEATPSQEERAAASATAQELLAALGDASLTFDVSMPELTLLKKSDKVDKAIPVYEPRRSRFDDDWLDLLARLVEQSVGVLRRLDGPADLGRIVVRELVTFRVQGSAHGVARFAKAQRLGTLDIVSCCFARIVSVSNLQREAMDVEDDAAVTLQTWWRGMLARNYVTTRHHLAARLIRKYTQVVNSATAACVLHAQQLFPHFQEESWDVLLSQEETRRAAATAEATQERLSIVNRAVSTWVVLEYRCRSSLESQWLVDVTLAEAHSQLELLYRDAWTQIQLVADMHAVWRLA